MERVRETAWWETIKSFFESDTENINNKKAYEKWKKDNGVTNNKNIEYFEKMLIHPDKERKSRSRHNNVPKDTAKVKYPSRRENEERVVEKDGNEIAK